LIASVKASNLPQKRQHDLLEELKEAGKEFARNHLRQGVEEVREFQDKVRKEVDDPALAIQFIQAAQKVIDKAKVQEL
jgi:hypothetical protein